MTIEEVKEMNEKEFKGFEKEKLLDAYVTTKEYKKEISEDKKGLIAIEKECSLFQNKIEIALQEQMEVGEQMSLDFDSSTFTSTIVELDEININCDEAVLYTACLKAGLTLYLKNSINLTAIKKDYKNGSLHPDLLKYIVVTKQQAMKISKKAKKEEE
jgi:hypothetical protein